MKVKAKFRCNFTTDFGNQIEANFSAVTGKEGDNADYSKYTPSGSLTIRIDKGTIAAKVFEPQKNYYLTFEPEEL